jgi:parallel beta-helix repeat protein
MKRRNMKNGIVISILLLVIGASVIPTVLSHERPVTTPVSLATIKVDNEGDGDYTTIAAALANATIGDTIEVYSGTYTEKNLLINKTLDVIGIPEELGSGTDTGKPVVNANATNSTGNVFKLEANGATISGFVIKRSGAGGSDAGIRVWGSNSDNNTISNNEINNCTMAGIIFNQGAENNIVTGNTFRYNKYGINCGPSADHNIIYYNAFYKDAPVGYETATSSSSERNTWNLTIGNYWSDYTGVDANQDGIGDTPYEIPGSSNEWDYRPLMYPLDLYPPVFESIVQPVNYSIYIFGEYFGVRPMNISKPLLLFGNFTFTINVTDHESGMQKVEFYINNEYKADGIQVKPNQYNWTWSEKAFGSYNVTVKAYDLKDNTAQIDFPVYRVKLLEG